VLKRSVMLCAVFVAMAILPRPAAADWLLSGYVAPVSKVKTSQSDALFVPAENFDNSVGYGINLASAFPSRGNLGFELDLGFYPEGLKTSDVFGTAYASRLLGISTNFFFSPSTPHVRPYVSIGPTFDYRSDRDEALVTTPSGWGVGMNGGGGIIAFANEHIGGRVDFRYFRNFGDFYDLRADVTSRRSGWKDLQFFRIFVGATVVLH